MVVIGIETGLAGITATTGYGNGTSRTGAAAVGTGLGERACGTERTRFSTFWMIRVGVGGAGGTFGCPNAWGICARRAGRTAFGSIFLGICALLAVMTCIILKIRA